MSKPARTFKIGGDLEVNRLGFGAMRLTGKGIWGQPEDVDEAKRVLKRAVELSSPERMRELEKSQAKNWVLTKKTRQDKPFVRSAKAGGWKSTLSTQSVALLESAWGGLMSRMGYELTGVLSSPAPVAPSEANSSLRSE